MKMKKYLYLLLYVWTGVLFASCENVLDYQQKEQPRQLVVNALLESDVAGNKVYLSLSGKTSAGYLEEVRFPFMSMTNGRRSRRLFVKLIKLDRIS